MAIVYSVTGSDGRSISSQSILKLCMKLIDKGETDAKGYAVKDYHTGEVLFGICFEPTSRYWLKRPLMEDGSFKEGGHRIPKSNQTYETYNRTPDLRLGGPR